MNPSQRSNEYSGVYSDAEKTRWSWSCPQPARKGGAGGGAYGKPFYVEGWDWIEYMLWTAFCAGVLSVLGWPVYFICGTLLQIYYNVRSWWGLYLALFDDNTTEYTVENWIIYPWREEIVFELLYISGYLFSLIPGVSLLMILWAWLSVLNNEG